MYITKPQEGGGGQEKCALNFRLTPVSGGGSGRQLGFWVLDLVGSRFYPILVDKLIYPSELLFSRLLNGDAFSCLWG